VADGTGVSFIRCKASKVKVVDENGHHTPERGFGTGFGWAPDPRPDVAKPAINVLYLDCIAEYCQLGFDSFFHIDSVWAYIVSKCNGIAILKKEGGQRTISCNPCSECGCTAFACFPTPLVTTLDNVAANNQFVHVKKVPCKKKKGC
jgi:hypothetical protein